MVDWTGVASEVAVLPKLPLVFCWVESQAVPSVMPARVENGKARSAQSVITPMRKSRVVVRRLFTPTPFPHSNFAEINLFSIMVPKIDLQSPQSDQ